MLPCMTEQRAAPVKRGAVSDPKRTFGARSPSLRNTILDVGHFALDEAAAEVCELTCAFLRNLNSE
jgi:hypothetical protein